MANDTGVIYGIAYGPSPKKSVTIHVYNEWHTEGIKFDIIMSSVYSIKPVVVWKDVNFKVYIGEPFNLSKGFLIGGENLNFTYSSLPNGVTFDPITQSFSGLVLEKIGTTIKFVVNNKYGSLDFSFLFVSKYTKYVIAISEDKTLDYFKEYDNFIPLLCVGDKILNYTIDPDLPASLEYNETSGIAKGKVTQIPPYEEIFTVECCNNDSCAEGTNKITIDEGENPILISHEDEIQIYCGNEYNISICKVLGKHLKYYIYPELEGNLQLNEDTGIISGKILKELKYKEYNITIKGKTEEISFKLIIKSDILPYPVVIEESIIENSIYNIGEVIQPHNLFDVIGINIRYEIEPKLPIGVELNELNGQIYGRIYEYTNITKYIFKVYSLNNPVIVEVNVTISIVLDYCENDNGFERTICSVNGNITYINCGKNKDGNKNRICYVNNNNKCEWSEINTNECSIKQNLLILIMIGSILLIITIVLLIIYIIYKIKKNRNSKSLLQQEPKV